MPQMIVLSVMVTVEAIRIPHSAPQSRTVRGQSLPEEDADGFIEHSTVTLLNFL